MKTIEAELAVYDPQFVDVSIKKAQVADVLSRNEFADTRDGAAAVVPAPQTKYVVPDETGVQPVAVDLNVTVEPGATPRFATLAVKTPAAAAVIDATVIATPLLLVLATYTVVPAAGVASVHVAHVNWIGCPTKSMYGVVVERSAYPRTNVAVPVVAIACPVHPAPKAANTLLNVNVVESGTEHT